MLPALAHGGLFATFFLTAKMSTSTAKDICALEKVFKKVFPSNKEKAGNRRLFLSLKGQINVTQQIRYRNMLRREHGLRELPGASTRYIVFVVEHKSDRIYLGKCGAIRVGRTIALSRPYTYEGALAKVGIPPNPYNAR